MTATTDVPDLVESWAAAEQGSDVEALDRLLAGDFIGVGLVGFVLGRDQWLARFGNGLENRGTAASRRAHPTRATETERHPEDENEVRSTMEGFDPFDSFGLEVASSYDEDLRGDEAETVEFLAEHAGAGPVLEFAIGTGRIALPLSERGIRVDGIEQSTAMVDQLRAKPGADKISITIGDMSAVELPEQYTLVYLVFNTIHNLLTQDGQVRCFENAARHLDSDGVFVVETGVPWRGPREGSYIEVPKVTMGEVRISPHTYDAMTQILDISHLRLTTEGIQMFPLSLRLVYPSELDLMARIAGLRLRHRWGGWKQETFTVHSRRHVSVYERR